MIYLIEDGAQSFGAKQNNKRSCGLSYIGTTSFFPLSLWVDMVMGELVFVMI